MLNDEQFPPTQEEYAARQRFIFDCLNGFVADFNAKRNKEFYFHRTAPKALTDHYYQVAAKMRSELSLSLPIPLGDDRRRIDRHKIAAGLLKTINALQPIRLAKELRSEQPGYNALLGHYVVTAFFTKWHEANKVKFQLTRSGLAFASENIIWLAMHRYDVPHQLMAQALYLFEACCFLEANSKTLDGSGS